MQSGLHSRVYDQLATGGGSRFSRWASYDVDGKVAYAYLELLYEIFERVFLLYRKQWIPQTEWSQLEAWMTDVIGNPLFRDVREDNMGMFDPAFEELVGHAARASQAMTAW